MLGSLSNTVPRYVGGSPICEPEHRASTLHVQAALEGLEALRESCAGTAEVVYSLVSTQLKLYLQALEGGSFILTW